MATEAKSKTDVEKMDKRQRKWDSLTDTYDKKRKSTAEQFAKAYSQADRQALSRGMQRSTQNSQTLANLSKQGVDAQGDIDSEQIAAYENWLSEEEQRELENERWERQFAANREDAAWNKDYQQQTLDWSKEQFQKGNEFTAEQNQLSRDLQERLQQANQTWQSGENELNRKFTTSEREATQAFTTSERKDTQAWQSKENAADRSTQYGIAAMQVSASAAQAAANREWQSAENALDREYQRERAAAADAQWEKQYNQSLYEFNTQMEYQKARAGVSDAQWEKQYELSRSQFDAQMAENKRQFDLEYGLKADAAAAAATTTATTGNPKPDTNRDWFDELGDTDFSKKYQTSTNTTRNTSGNSIFSSLRNKTGA